MLVVGAALSIRTPLLYRFHALAAFVGCLVASACLGDKPAKDISAHVRVTFEVRLPEAPEAVDDASKSIEVFVPGNLKSFGQWKPDGLKLKRSDDGLYRGEISAPAETKLEFKMTQGTWAQVEKDLAGRDILNRRVEVAATADSTPQRIEVTVERWASMNPVGDMCDKSRLG